MRLANIPILYKVLGCVIALGIVSGGALWFTTSNMQRIGANYAALIDNDAVALKSIIRSNVRVSVMQGLLEKHVLAATPEEKAAAADEINRTVAEFFDLNAAAKEKADLVFGSAIDGVKIKFQAFLADVEGLQAASLVNDAARTHAALKVTEQKLTSIKSLNVAATDAIETAMKAQSDAAAADTVQTVYESIITVSVAILAIMALAFAVAQYGIARPLARLAETMRTLAGGDFSAVVAGTDRKDEVGLMARSVEVFKENGLEAARLRQEQEATRAKADEERRRNEAYDAARAKEREAAIGALGQGLAALAGKDLTYRIEEPLAEAYRKLKDNFNAAMDQMEGVIRSVSASTTTMATGTQEISSASDDLSRRTESQAASLEETAAAVAEITNKVRQTAQGAAHARTIVASAREEAAKSSDVVKRAIDSMTGIERTSQQITKIIGVIDEIAFQTNLLALNAGVEAARAGDAGRGFAVVAQEVRALAQRSAEAAKEIKTLIGNAQTEVDQGVHLVSETGHSLERIVARVSEINKVVSDIASAAEEQASGLAQVNTAVDQMDQTTQQNAAMVEEATAATKNLARESDELNAVIATFVTTAKEMLTKARRSQPVAVPHRPAPMASPRKAAATATHDAVVKAEEWAEF